MSEIGRTRFESHSGHALTSTNAGRWDDVTTWGWIHMLIGAVLTAAGFCLFAGAVWARTIGVIVAILTVIANFLWVPYSPIWSLLLIPLAIHVIWALTTHGRDMTA